MGPFNSAYDSQLANQQLGLGPQYNAPRAVNVTNGGGLMSSDPRPNFQFQQQQPFIPQQANFFDPSVFQRPTSMQLSQAAGVMPMQQMTRDPYKVGLMGGM
jgi:hypothetical protein